MSRSNFAIHDGCTDKIPDGVTAHLENLVALCRAHENSDVDLAKSMDIDATVSEIQRILFHRRYCYLSKSNMRRFEEQVTADLTRMVASATPLKFFYDIGGGYHASVEPDHNSLSFLNGLSEFYILSQICAFAKEIRAVYAPGIHFTLVVDNLCAYFVNEISIEKTEAYCASLQGMIDELGLSATVSLLVESKHFSHEDYEKAAKSGDSGQAVFSPTPVDIENVSRFVGKKCSVAETVARLGAYDRYTQASDDLVNQAIDGIRMTQREGETTPPFRPFPGGAVRTQTGELILTTNNGEKFVPRLLTSRNNGSYRLHQIALPASLPSSIQVARFGFCTD